jgi:hypothetical protein
MGKNLSGLIKYAGDKLHERNVNRQAEREHAKEERLENCDRYEKGYHEGSFKRRVIEGSGGVTAQTKYAGRSGGRAPQRLTGSGGFSGSMQNYDKVFGASGFSGGMGSGLGFGGGGGSKSRPDRVITKANGKVRIEEYGSKHDSDDGFGSLGLGGGLGLDGFGGSGGSGKKSKREPHPYEF